MSDTTENLPVETTPTEQVETTPQEVQQTEQPTTTSEATPEVQSQAETKPTVTEEIPKPFELPVAEQPTPQDPFENLSPEIVAERFKDKEKQVALLKQLGFDDFALGALEYYQATGSLAEYAEVKSVDYTKLPDTEIMARKLREQYTAQGLTVEEANLLIEDELNSRFKLDDEVYSERDVQIGKIKLKAEAAEFRKTLMERQAQFKAPERVVAQAEPQTPQPTYEQVVEQNRQRVIEDKSVQQFLQAGKLQLGTDSPLNYEVQNPQEALAIVYDNNRYIYQMAQKNEKGEVLMKDGQPVLDYAKVIKAANYIQNMEAIENALINHGRTLGKKAMMDEAENVVSNQSFAATKGADDPYSGLVNKILQMGA